MPPTCFVLWLKQSSIIFLNIRSLAQSHTKQAMNARRLIGIKSVEEGNRISPLEGYWQLLKQKGGFSGFSISVLLLY